jgi:hypothetical protein|tara:strand:+ start:427 stop:831 length:405 start_codon:yes stop_codon:yes gene_type:complete
MTKDPTYSIFSKGVNIVNKNKEIDKKQLADLEKLQFDLERDIIDTIREDFEKQDKYKNFLDFLKSKDDDYFKRIELKEGGKVYVLSDYMKPKSPRVKEINLASLFDHTKTISSLTDAEREVVNDLLRRSLKGDK